MVRFDINLFHIVPKEKIKLEFQDFYNIFTRHKSVRQHTLVRYFNA